MTPNRTHGAVAGTKPGAASRNLARALASRRHELSLALLGGIGDWEKYAEEIAADREAFARREVHVFVDYLALFFRTGDVAYRSLYVGEKLKQNYHREEGFEARRARAAGLLRSDQAAIEAGLAGAVGPEELDLLRLTLEDIRRVILGETSKTLEILFIGDCLYQDLLSFLTPLALETGIAISPAYLTSKNGILLRNEMRGMAGRKFDLVMYSPLSYEFSPSLASSHRARRALAGLGALKALVDEAMGDAEATLAQVASQFDCPVIVQNTLNIRRHDGSIRERAHNLATGRARRITRGLANDRLARAIAAENERTFEHLFLMDETLLLAEHGEADLGRYFYNSDIQHPAALGRALAPLFRDVLAAHARLAGKKLVVCDLDNTLWAGEIGEGRVEHFLDRQRTLKRLRQKGIVLAVNSKNDPKNVHWAGAALDQDDFVHMQINWDSKIVNMRRIQEALNLKFKDYVFLDDRGDQLALVSSAIPEILAMDATSGLTWDLLAAWERMLPKQTEADRTLQYREREAREGFIATLAEEDPSALFANLEIRVTLREAVRADLGRVTELINRTNQFNLAGSRTTFGEVGRWHDDPDDKILVVEASDKFGAMGLISVAVLRRDGEALRIPAFVLSCRVFGYGIEKAVINLAKRLAIAEGGNDPLTVLGAYKETSHNEPCRTAYPDSGFAWEDGVWSFKGYEVEPDATWLTIDDRVSPRGLAAGRPASAG